MTYARRAENEDEVHEMRNYNCGGYALGTRTWYRPTESDLPMFGNPCDVCEYEDCDNCGIFDNDNIDLEKTTNEAVECMLAEFPNLRLIKTEEEVKPFEIVVFFRIGYDDFHYVRKEKDGKYYHKMGWSPYIDEMDKEEVYDIDGWCGGRYCGPLVIFGYDERMNAREAV